MVLLISQCSMLPTALERTGSPTQQLAAYSIRSKLNSEILIKEVIQDENYNACRNIGSTQNYPFSFDDQNINNHENWDRFCFKKFKIQK